ncbi:bifunctional DNA primase/polymerase [Mycobacterium sp. CnD-18-1]|uniref:bifunctional DNA primase/polymerase n=1 Tax=Mycobacterium sp. CnD-18-1 TaxID=2917744 RepID=UPI001EF3518B|nr:bifunctional DNA primase/polymerase [Mycobacterium sp. CnD-18-1]MCG7607148.1 bifunctional DNA primase/polymerase [Mycobacterium sp. CnD-18-1]
MLTYTQCSSCGDKLLTSFVGQESHPDCPKSESEILARQFIDAIQADDLPEIKRLEKLINQPKIPSLGAAAMWYATVAHWPIFPVAPGQKRPLTKNGLKDASTDPEQVQQWWSRWPEANIGGVTGIFYDVIDIDGPEGFESVRNLEPGVIPDVHGKSNTRRGQHIFIKPTGDGNRAGVRPGLDYRGKGGYVLLPVSKVDLHTYSWAVKPSPEIMGAK